AVATGAGVAIEPSECMAVKGRSTPLRPGLGVPRQLDLSRLSEGRRGLLALTATAAIDRDEARAAPVDAGETRLLHWQLGHCCPVTTGVATVPRSALPAIPLPMRNQRARPTGFEPVTFGFVVAGSALRCGIHRHQVTDV